MSTFGTMVDRIEADINRDSSADTSVIKREIVTAIDEYKTERFRFNEAKLSLTTTADDGDYTSVLLASDLSTVQVDDIFSIDALYYVDNNANLQLRRRPYQYVRALESTSFTGRPVYWAYGDQQLTFSPIPDDAYSITGDMHYDFSSVTSSSASSATNDWFTIGEKLIRMQAMGNVYANHLRDYEKANIYWAQAAQEFRRLRRDYEQMATAHEIMPHYF